MATRMMKPPIPRPVAFCWYRGQELSLKEVAYKGCQNPAKQANETGICKHFQAYGSREKQAN
jgi:hypothetical protein